MWPGNSYAYSLNHWHNRAGRVVYGRVVLSKGYQVVGGVRDIKNPKCFLCEELDLGIDLVLWNMSDQGRMKEVIEKCQLDEVYNFAAYPSATEIFEEPIAIAEVTGVAALDASTKGSMLLQYSGINTREVDFVGEVNSEKFDCYTPGTRIPIIPGADLLAKKPDYLIVFPLPDVEVAEVA